MPQIKKFDRETVLIKAMNLFWEKGFHATSMQDLVKVMGINRASMYDTYGNKLTLYKESLAYYHKNLVTYKADFLYQHVVVRQGLNLLFEDAIAKLNQQGLAKGCFLMNSLTEMANADFEFKNQLVVYKKEMEQVFYNYLLYGQNQSQISPYKDIASLATYLHMLELNIKTQSILDSNKAELQKMMALGLLSLE